MSTELWWYFTIGIAVGLLINNVMFMRLVNRQNKTIDHVLDLLEDSREIMEEGSKTIARLREVNDEVVEIGMFWHLLFAVVLQFKTGAP
jgi:uncharacterized membrane-anchored protein YhcB (DUF1043 family)